MAKVLIVEDDDVIATGISRHLEDAGYSPVWVADGKQALARLRFEQPDVCVLDLMLPGLDGWAFIETARAEGIGTPIVVVSARGTEHDRVHALEIGADDYLVKPFSMKELVARINANLKRSETGQRGKILEAGDLQLDTKNFTVRIKGEPLDLRLKEFELLAALASAPGELKSREELAKEVWGHAGVGSSRTIDVHIRRIRAALEERSSYQYIHTARGLGYRFEAKSRAGVGPE